MPLFALLAALLLFFAPLASAKTVVVQDDDDDAPAAHVAPPVQGRTIQKFIDDRASGERPTPPASTPAAPTQSVSPAPATPPPVQPGARAEIQLHRDSGVLVVPVQINNAMTLDFTIDSGAADVSVSQDVVNKLMRAGALKQSDFVGHQTYTLADGSTVRAQTFRIRVLKVGNREIQNVLGSVADSGADLLLGQTFLSRFKSWSIDNQRQMLVLE